MIHFIVQVVIRYFANELSASHPTVHWAYFYVELKRVVYESQVVIDSKFCLTKIP